MNGSLLLSGRSQWVRYRNVALGSVWVNVASGGRLFSQRSVAVGRRKSRGAFGEGKVAMGKEIVAWELSRWEVLPVENLQRRLDQSFAGSHLILLLTIQATGIAQPGMSSLQNPRTSVRAVISKGINSAS